MFLRVKRRESSKLTIHIEDLKFQTIIGILDFERDNEQTILVNLTIDYEYKDKFINYGEVVELIKSYIQKKQFLLIEDALLSLSVSTTSLW